MLVKVVEVVTPIKGWSKFTEGWAQPNQPLRKPVANKLSTISDWSEGQPAIERLLDKVSECPVSWSALVCFTISVC